MRGFRFSAILSGNVGVLMTRGLYVLHLLLQRMPLTPFRVLVLKTKTGNL